MKNKVLPIVVLLFLMGFCAYFYYEHEIQIHRHISAFRDSQARDCQYKMMHEQRVDISNLPALEDETDAWYTKYHVIAHAGGGIDGKTYTNSLEAWDYSYSRGTRVFDADCSFTSDSVLVLRHDWGDNLEQGETARKDSWVLLNSQLPYLSLYYNQESDLTDYETFMNRKIYRKYNPISCEMMLRYMDEHADLFIATDMHLGDVEKTYKYIVDKAREIGLESVLDRIIPNIYNTDTYDIIMELYPFPNVTARQHGLFVNNYYELIDFCIRHNIHVVNTTSQFMYDEGIQLLLSKNIHVITAIVDYLSDMHEYRKLGSTGCVSNFIYEDIYNLSE